jgi:membrane protease YdiL (CAAX protease family)
MPEAQAPSASVVGSLPQDARYHGDPARAPVVAALYFFLALLALSVVEGLLGGALLDEESFGGDRGQAVRGLITLFEAVDSALVVAAVCWVARPPALPRQPASRRLQGWLAGGPLLLAALAANLGYHFLLNDYLALPDDWTPMESLRGASKTWLVLALCLQPAIFEEIFFRYLMLGHLRSVTGAHGAVWVSSLVFGLAHLGAPLSIPMLIVVGVALGYARVWSGSLLLPMLMHFAHNLVVICLETQA